MSQQARPGLARAGCPHHVVPASHRPASGQDHLPGDASQMSRPPTSTGACSEERWQATTGRVGFGPCKAGWPLSSCPGTVHRVHPHPVGPRRVQEHVGGGPAPQVHAARFSSASGYRSPAPPPTFPESQVCSRSQVTAKGRPGVRHRGRGGAGRRTICLVSKQSRRRPPASCICLHPPRTQAPSCRAILSSRPTVSVHSSRQVRHPRVPVMALDSEQGTGHRSGTPGLLALGTTSKLLPACTSLRPELMLSAQVQVASPQSLGG